MVNRLYEIQYYNGFSSSSLQRKHIEAETEAEALEKFKEWAENIEPRPDYNGMVEIPVGCI